VNDLARAAARFLLPSVCLACRLRCADDFFRGGVCGACWESLPAPEPDRCGRCDERLPGAPPEGSLCGRCLIDPPDFERLRAAAPYRGSARGILLAFKFQGADFLATHMAQQMALRLPAPDAGEIAAVPATRRARRGRGYHPAEALAEAVARRLGLDFVRGRLVKTRETAVQSRLPASARPANVRRAFRVDGRPAARVLLVDDVGTSGATARECAHRLAVAGARSVTVWCFARASRADLPLEAA
jgi:predicted amidophosphoribosyltransferase